MTTSLFVTRFVRPVTPVVPSTSSIHVPLADAKTSAPPSDSICAARPSDGPKLNVTVTPGCAASKSAPIAVNPFVSEEPANTVSSVAAGEPSALGPTESLEHPVSAITTPRIGINHRRNSKPPCDREH